MQCYISNSIVTLSYDCKPLSVNVIFGQFHGKVPEKISVFSTQRMCSDHIISNKLWLFAQSLP